MKNVSAAFADSFSGAGNNGNFSIIKKHIAP
jgi:hypothetical protein